MHVYDHWMFKMKWEIAICYLSLTHDLGYKVLQCDTNTKISADILKYIFLVSLENKNLHFMQIVS